MSHNQTKPLDFASFDVNRRVLLWFYALFGNPDVKYDEIERFVSVIRRAVS